MQQEVAFIRSQSAYKQLFLHFYKPVSRFAMTILRSKEEADEVYQDVMLKIWDLGPDLAGIKDLRTYLLTITRNAAINYLNKYHKISTTGFTAQAHDLTNQVDPEQIFLHTELKEIVEEAVCSLPPQCKMVYHLIRENGFSYKEACQIMDISVKTAERHMTIALQRLLQTIEAYRRANQG